MGNGPQRPAMACHYRLAASTLVDALRMLHWRYEMDLYIGINVNVIIK